jgi:siroheme synthase-like protein
VTAASPPPYLSGLILAGRAVVVLGAGAVAQRRLPRLLGSGAVVRVIAPEATPAIARMARRGELTWTRRCYGVGDLAEAWYVLVATNDDGCNRAASTEAEQNRIFCVRSDRAVEATAWTPATGEVDGLLVAVLSGGNPRRASAVRDGLIGGLRKVRRLAA